MLSDGREQDKEEDWGGVCGGGGGDLCGVVMSNFWTNGNAALSKLISLLASGANDWGRSVGSPAS